MRSTLLTALTSCMKARCLKKARPRKSSAIGMSGGSICANGSHLRAPGAEIMALTQRLELRQGQSLVMTPQLQQAIKLLTLSNLELTQYVEQALERNPLLERD